MTLDEAKEILDQCERDELRDHAFGDSEVSWIRNGKEVASGYFGRTENTYVSFGPYKEVRENGKIVRFEALGSFNGDDAEKLRHCGKLGVRERNDSTGLDTYRGA